MSGNWVHKWLINRDMDMCLAPILFFAVNHFCYLLFELNLHYPPYPHDNPTKILLIGELLNDTVADQSRFLRTNHID